MVASIISKVMRIARGAALAVGVAVMLALTVGLASTALGANGKPFILGKSNVATKISKLVKSGVGPALDLQVDSGQPPMAVNSDAQVANLNADKLDGQDAGAFLGADAAAGGDLTGNYPNPGIAEEAVGEEEVDSDDVQLRVFNSCFPGSSIRSISETATVNCETDGVTGREVVVNSTGFNDTQLKNLTAVCPAGKTAISGGGQYSASETGFVRSDAHDIALQQSIPGSSVFPDRDQWSANADWVGEGTPPMWRLVVYVVCVNE